MTTPDQVHRSVADRGDTLDHDEFRRGFSDAIDYLESLPGAWACHHASATLEPPVSETGDRSHLRGYRAALFGYLRGGPLGAVTADPHTVPALRPVGRSGRSEKVPGVVAGVHTVRL